MRKMFNYRSTVCKELSDSASVRCEHIIFHLREVIRKREEFIKMMLREILL
jgi:hypothetical protein